MSDSADVCVKVIGDHPTSYTAEVRAAHYLAGTDISTPQLLDHGTVDGQHWLAYQLHDLTPFTATTQHVEQAGQLLGALHAATVGINDPQLRRYGTVHDLITDKIDRVAQFDTAIADRVQRLYDAMIARDDNLDLDDDVCLLHGDMGWRNLHHETHSQALWVIDFEHAAIGHPLLDFAKLWDRELHDPATRTAFLNGYQQHRLTDLLRTDAINAVRLWAAAGIFPYARQHDDQPLRAACIPNTRQT